MKLMRTATATVLGLAIFWCLALIVLGNPLWQWSIAVMGGCMTLAIFLKALHIGRDTLRGRFHVILSSGLGLVTISIIATLLEIPQPIMVTLHCFARIILLLSVTLMFLGLKKQGYSLSAYEWGEVLLVYLTLSATGLWFFYVTFEVTDLLLTLLIYLSLTVLLVTISVVRIYLGSNIGWLWTAGAVGVLFITLGDMGMAYGYSTSLNPSTSAALEMLQYGSWGVLGIILTCVGLNVD